MINPDYFIQQLIRPKDLIQEQPGILIGVPVEMQVKRAIRRQQLVHQVKTRIKHIQVGVDVFPIILVTCVVGAFAGASSLFDVKIMLAFGVIGYLMRKLGFPVTPFLIAFILGPLTEVSLREAMIIHQGDLSVFLTRPVSLVCLILTVLSVVFIARRRIRGEKAFVSG